MTDESRRQTEAIERAERMTVRHMCGVTVKDKKSSEELRQRRGIDSVSDVIRRSRLRWFGLGLANPDRIYKTRVSGF